MSQPQSYGYSDAAEQKQLKHLATEVFGVKLGKIIRSGDDANLVGIKSEYVLVSRRLDSRTFFVQDTRYGVDREAGVFRGSDREHINACRSILKRLDIPVTEIAREDVLKERTRVAQLDRETRKVRMEKVQDGKYIVRLSRSIEGLPVWSSRLLLGLTKEKHIGYMELHWPTIPDHVVLEAHRLQYKVKHNWRPPDWPGTIIEKVEAGIIHSPAISLVMDIYPVIRVIYRPTEKRYGVKPVLFLDRQGKPVPIPRQAELPIEAPQQRKLPDRKEASS